MSISKQAEQIREISGVNPYKCMKCGKCSGRCPAFKQMFRILPVVQRNGH